MRILAIGDFHGKFPVKLKRIAKSCDLILCTGDISSHDIIEWKYWKRLRAGEKLVNIIGKHKLEKYLAKDLANAKKIVKELDKTGVPTIVAYGNGDITNEYLRRQYLSLKGIESIVKNSKNIKLVRCGKAVFNDLVVLCHSGYRGYSAKKGDPNGCLSKESIQLNSKWKRDMKILAKHAKGNFIFLTHDVPFGKLDKIGNRKSPAFGEHMGDEFYLIFNKNYKPAMHVCGHMHENQGTERIGKTLVVATGAAYEGKAAIIECNGKNIKIKLIR